MIVKIALFIIIAIPFIVLLWNIKKDIDKEITKGNDT